MTAVFVNNRVKCSGKEIIMTLRTKHILRTLICILMIMVGLLTLSAYNTYATDNAVDEIEPNNSWNEANTISFGTTVYGSTVASAMQTIDGDDFFKFTAPVSGTAKVTMYADKMDEDAFAFIYVKDDSDKELAVAQDRLSTVAGDSVEFPVKSGKTYYLNCCAHNGLYGFSCDYHFTLNYSIGRTTIKSAAGKKNGFTVKWNKKEKASFYEIQYVKKSVYNDYNWKKAITIKVSRKSGSKTIKKLNKNKKYYVRVRVARTIDGETYYSSWSPKKVVKTK